jgi:hypothetical protein
VTKPAVIAVLLVLCGVGLRVVGLSDPPLDFHPTRQYHGAIMARGYSIDLLSSWDPAARLAAEVAARNEGRFEPPVMQHLASWVYHAVGREELALARALAVLAWSLGGVALYWLAIQFVAAPAAITAVALWTFTPFAIRASRSFQPDPLMTALIVLSLAAAVSCCRRPTAARIALFGCVLAAALAVKGVSVFFLAPALPVLVLLGESSIRTKAVVSGVAIAAVAPAAWYYWTLQLPHDFGPYPQLLVQQQFWRDWATIINRVVSWPLLIAAVAGGLASTGELRRLIVALLGGYVAFGMVFTHHIHTHDYYSLALVPIVALGVGALMELVGRRLAVRTRVAVATTVCVGCIAWGGQEVVYSQRAERVMPLRAAAARYERIGQIVGHSTRVLSFDENYGTALIYHGRLATSGNWLLSGDLAARSVTGEGVAPADDRLRAANADFFVCTSQAQMDAQPDLGALLTRQHPLLERNSSSDRWEFAVYDLRRTIVSVTPSNLSLFSHVGEPAPAAESISLFAAPTASWTVRVPQHSSIRVMPMAGTGSAILEVSSPTPTAEVDRTETVVIDGGLNSGSTSFEVRTRALAGSNQPPFGFVDAPADPIALGKAAVVIQGWALDDTAMQRVWVGYVDSAGRTVPLGNAHRDGRRPDLVAAYPTAHDLFKAAWVFTLDPATASGIPRPFDLLFFAEDGSGNTAQIGRRRVR